MRSNLKPEVPVQAATLTQTALIIFDCLTSSTVSTISSWAHRQLASPLRIVPSDEALCYLGQRNTLRMIGRAMLKIMISYRRSDSEAITGRIFDRLAGHYGKSCVFRDIDGIPLGVDFRYHIAKVLDESSVVLVVIGPRWIGRKGAQSRLSDPADPVRIEVETALRKGVPVIPLLAGRVGIPKSEQLPESLRDITYRNGLRIDAGLDFDHHLDRLIQEIDAILASTTAARVEETQSSAEPVSAELRRWKGHPKGVRSVAALSDNRRALSSAEDGTIRLWDLDTTQELRRLEGHTSMVLSVAVLPNGDTALSGSFDNTMRLWDLKTGTELRRFEGHAKWVEAVAVLPEVRQAISGSGDWTIRLWDLKTGAELRHFAGHCGTVSSLAVLSAGQRVLSGSHDGSMRLWDPQTGEELRRFGGNQPGINSVAGVPGGRQAISGSADMSVRLWDLNRGTELRRFEAHASPVTSVAVFADGRRALSGSEDGIVRLWDLATGAQLDQVEGLTGGVGSLTVLPDGRRVLCGLSDGTLCLWEMGTAGNSRFGAP